MSHASPPPPYILELLRIFFFLAQALFTLNFLDLRLDHKNPAATLHFQNTILSENYTPGKMIADNTPVWKNDGKML